MNHIGRASRLALGQREKVGNGCGITDMLKAEPGQQGRPSLEAHSTMIRPRERSSVKKAWALSLLINTLCIIVFIIAFRRDDVPPAKTSDAEIPASSAQQLDRTVSNPLAPQPVLKVTSPGRQPTTQAGSPATESRKKQREEKYRKELHKVQQDFLKNDPE